MVPHLNYEHLNYQQLPDAHHTSKVLTEIMDTTVNLKPTGTIMLQLLQSPFAYYEGLLLVLLKTYGHKQRPLAMRQQTN